MTKNTNLNTKYTCIPLNQQQQQQHQPIQYNNSNNQQHQYWSKTSESNLNTPLKSLERLVSLPETQVIDPKSVVNDNNDSNCINYDFDYQQQQQHQYKANLKRLNSYEYNDDLFNNNKKSSSQHQQHPQQQQQYYYNNNINYYSQQQQPPEQTEPASYLCDQQPQNFNDNYYYHYRIPLRKLVFLLFPTLY